MKKIIIAFLIVGLSASLVLVSRGDTGKDNPYKIDNECYRIFEKIYSIRYNDSIFYYVDLMKQRAREVNDPKAEIIAEYQKLFYYGQHKDYTHLNECFENVKQLSRAHGYMQYYFGAYSQCVTSYVNGRRFIEARRLASRCMREAREMKDNYGISNALASLASLYTSMGADSLAFDAYNKRIDFIAANLPDQSICVPTLLAIAVAPDSATKFQMLERARGERRSFLDTIRVIEQEMYLCSKYGKWDDYERAKQAFPASTAMTAATKYFIDIRRLLHEQLYDSALNYIDKEITAVNKLPMKLAVYELRGDSANTYDIMKKMMASNDSLYHSDLTNAILRMTSEIERDAVERERLQNETESQRLLAEEARMQAEMQRQENMHKEQQLRSQAEAARMEAENGRLLAENQAQQLKMLKSQTTARNMQLEAQRVELERQKARARYTQIILIVSCLSLVILAIVFFLWLHNHRRLMKRLLGLTHQLRTARAEAIAASKMKDRFVQNMSHEIRTPLNAVMGFSQLLTIPGVPVTDEEKVEYGQAIQVNSNMLLMLIDDILNVSDIETGQYSVSVRNYKISEICDSCLHVVQYRVPPEVELNFVNELPADYTIETDARRCQQVIINFLTNACKHTEKGRIEVRTSASPRQGNIIFSVTDTGSGIPKEERKVIFERFRKLNDFKQGTGLGLNICLSIAERLGGRVWCDPDYDNGSRFCFEHPVNQTT